MSEVPVSNQLVSQVGGKSLWPVAAVILVIIFAPAALAWVVSLL